MEIGLLPRALVPGYPSAVLLVGRSRQVLTHRPPEIKERALSHGISYTPEQSERLRAIHQKLVEARRELDALIGDAYLRPRASIVPVHFLDLAAAVEKLRWAEKEWRELDVELAESGAGGLSTRTDDEDDADEEPALAELASN